MQDNASIHSEEEALEAAFERFLAEYEDELTDDDMREAPLRPPMRDVGSNASGVGASESGFAYEAGNAEDLPEGGAQDMVCTVDDNNKLIVPGQWYSQYISVKHPRPNSNAASSRYGAYEGVCRFHAKNARTGCKKLFSIEGPLEADRSRALLRCKWWLCQANSVDTQLAHLYTVDTLFPPALSAVETLAPRVAPANIIPDDQKDLTQGAASSGQGQAAAAAPRAAAAEARPAGAPASGVAVAKAEARPSQAKAPKVAGKAEARSKAKAKGERQAQGDLLRS